ncbi:MAG: cohesin domain-containing protein [Pedobacter sp.]
MRYLTHLIISGLILGLFSGCSSSRRAFSKGEKFESEGKYEEAMYSYADAFSRDPETSEYRLRFLRARDTAADMHYKMGTEQYDKGDYVAALAEFQSAYGLDPTRGRFKDQVEVTTRLKDAQLAYQEGLDFEKANKLKDANRSFTRALELSPANKEYLAARSNASGLSKSKLEGYELHLKSNKPITLKFKDAKIKDVFNILSQLSGINFIFDEGIKDVPVTIYLENATFQQALDLMTNMFKLGSKIANESTVIIYSRTPEKLKQYEDMQLRTFHLNYMEAKKAVNLIRTMIQVRKIYVNEDTNSVVIRDTSDVVDVVEKILDANDVPDPEVILDVEVIEVSNTNSQRLGLLLSNYNVQLGAFSPNGNLLSPSSLATTTSTSTTTGTTTTNSVTIDNLIRAFSIKGYGGFITVPNATYNFGKTLAKSEVLSNPKIRVKNKEKAKFTVGTRLPITTSNTTNSTVSVNVQYVDVGVKVNVEPTIQLNNEVVIKLSLEVSQQVGAARDVGGGTSVVTIGTRNLETVLSLKDGETSIIGGLIQKNTGDDKSKLFILSDIPIIGPLFTDTNFSNSKNELMLAITPRLIRGVSVPQGNLMSFGTGKEDDPSLVKSLAAFDLEPEFETKPKAEQKQPSISPAQPAPAVQKTVPPQLSPATVGMPALPSSPVQEPLPAIPVQDTAAGKQIPGATPSQAAVPVALAAPQRGLLRILAPTSILLGQQFSLELKVSDVNELLSAPLALTYDPVFVEFVSAAKGNFFTKDGKLVTFSSKVDPASGTVTITLARGPGSGGVSGDGTLVSALFRAKKQGSATFGFRNVSFLSADGKPVTILPFSTVVEIH